MQSVPIVVQCYSVTLVIVSMHLAVGGGGLALKSLKRICFQCHMPNECFSGFCYGDYCVKSVVGDKYVSKGCENRSSVGVYSSRSKSYYPQADPTGCFEMDVFGMPNVMCYCNDADFCNGASRHQPWRGHHFHLLHSAAVVLTLLMAHQTYLHVCVRRSR